VKKLLAAILCLFALAAGPTSRPVITNIAAPGAVRWAWSWAGLSGVVPGQVKPDLAQWRAFVAAVRDNKPLHRDWSGRDYYWWDANTTGILLDAESVTSSDRPLADKLAFMETITRSARATAPRLALGWYGDPSILYFERTRYPWSADLIGEAMRNRDASRRLHALCDYIVIGAYYGDDRIATPEKWTDFCQGCADNARLYRLVYPDKPLAWLTMSFANVGWSRPKRADESDTDYRLSLAPSREQVAELREAVGPYVDAIIVWVGEQDNPGEETLRMIDELRGGASH
jgi:hypothetical protein